MRIAKCTVAGVSVAGIPAARTFLPGDEVDLDVVALERPQHAGESVTWGDVLGDHVTSHFEVESAAPTKVRGRRQEPVAAEPVVE